MCFNRQKKEKPLLLHKTVRMVKQTTLKYNNTESVLQHSGAYISSAKYDGTCEETYFVEVKNIWSDGTETTAYRPMIAENQVAAEKLFEVFVKNNGEIGESVTVKEENVKPSKEIRKW